MDDVNLMNLTGHGLSTLAIIGAALGIFTPLAALAAFIWYCIQIYTSAPVQNWLRSRRERRLRKLRLQLTALELKSSENPPPK